MNYTFDYVKVELDRSIKDLMPRQKFQIILFSDGPPDEMKIDGQQGLHYAYAKNKAAAFDWVKKKYAKSSGGDVPDVDYFKAAFRDKSNLPQVIYVLTDGDFSIEVFDYLRQANKGKKVIINTISFMNREGEESLKKMATENGGTYRYIGEEELKKFIPPEDDSQSGTWNLND